MTRITVLLLSLLMLSSIAVSADSMADDAAKMNVILILIDDLGWEDLGCYGSEYRQTPNIDRLANEGMRFTDGYAACNVRAPTRAASMTGKYPARLDTSKSVKANELAAKQPGKVA